MASRCWPTRHDGVQSAAINALLSLYTVRADLRQRQWGPGSVGKSATPSEVAFEAGPLATMPAPVPAEALTGLSAVVRQDQSVKTRLDAAYALGTLGAPAMGPMPEATARRRGGATWRRRCRIRIGRRDRWWRGSPAGSSRRPRPAPCRRPSATRSINSMNDGDPLVRRWAMDSLGWLRYDRAVQALTDRASYYGKSEEGSAALHALARIAVAAERAGVPGAARQQRADVPGHLDRGARPHRRSLGATRPSPSRPSTPGRSTSRSPRTWRRSCWRRRPT